MFVYCLKESNFNQDGTNYEYLTHEREISGKDFHGMVKKVRKILDDNDYIYNDIGVFAEIMCERYGFQKMKPYHTMNLDWIPDTYREEENDDVYL